MQVCTWYANARKNSKIMLIICDTLFKVHKAQKYTINLCEYKHNKIYRLRGVS